jgi:hypothetical protein
LSRSFHSAPTVTFDGFPFDCHAHSLFTPLVEKLLIPIGMEVEAALTRERMEDAIRGKSTALVSDTFPAPNAWIPGGYNRFHAKLAALVNEAAPKVNNRA